MKDEELKEEVLKRLDKITDKLGEGANAFWPLAVKQVYINFGMSFVWLGFAYLPFHFMLNWYRLTIGGNVMIGSGVLITFLWLVVAIANVLTKLTAALNPKYRALIDLIKNQEVQ